MLVKKILSRRGQAMVLYALLIPVLFLFVGVGIDLGWYFINVSRLQNAADAAALAGAQALVKQDDFNKYLVVSLSSNELPADFDDYEDVYKNTFDSTTSATGILHNYKKIKDVEDALKVGRNFVEEYVRKNLADTEKVVDSDNNKYNLVTATDGWGLPAADKKVTGEINLKYKIVDGKNDVYGPLYYVVNLTEKIRHLFMPGWFEPMDAPVRAVVLLRPHYKGLIEPMEQLERTKVIDNWEYTNRYRGTVGAYEGKWNHYQAGIRNNDKYGIKYTNGNVYRTESVIVTPSDKNNSVNKNTEANGGKFYTESEVDSINIDFRAEVEKTFTTDWDIGQPLSAQQNYHFTEGWSATDGADKRILFNTEFNEAFKKRESVSGTDPLWVRIESDPIIRQLRRDGKYAASYNSVRQVTLNFNKKNTDVANGEYKYRPYVIFYTGPENIDYTTTKDEYGNDVLIRHSQPVVLNLNEDTNAIIYMPNSPVIINGNNHALHGFVIAKCYLKAVTSEDMTGTGSFMQYDGFNTPKPFDCGYNEFTDGYGNIIYVKPENLFTLDGENNSVSSEHPNAEIKTEDNGNLTVSEKIQAPEYILLNYTKEDHNTYAVTEDDILNENKTFAAYVTATYKEKYKTYSGLTDSQITAVKFPDENYNETTATYYVANEYVSTSKKNDNYVKVLVNGSTMYADKTKLPYVKVRTDKEYFYVCVYDLKLTTYKVINNDNTTTTGKGVRMIDNSYSDTELTNSYKKDGNVTSTVGDIYINPTTINQYGDSWAVDRNWYNNKRNDWKKDKLDFYNKNGVAYFKIKSEVAAAQSSAPQVIATYRKVVVGVDSNGNEIVKYVKEGDKLYYTKVNNNTNHPENNNYIITDENGNILTKPVTAPEVLDSSILTKSTNESIISRMNSIWGRASDAMLRDYWKNYTRAPKDPEEIPGDRGGTNGQQYVGLSEYRKDEDYRIPALERVYLMSTFNLKTGITNDENTSENELHKNSYYSYFDIDELWRVNYRYLNVDEINHTVDREPSDKWQVEDMFFTTTRAGWID